MAQDQPHAALELYRQSLALRRQLGDRPAISLCLGAIGGVLLALGEAEHAATLISAGAALKEELGMVESPLTRAEIEKTTVEIQELLGKSAFSMAWEAGQTGRVDDMITLALTAEVSG